MIIPSNHKQRTQDAALKVLMSRNQETAAVMISHAWGGSVLETFSSMQTRITHAPSTRGNSSIRFAPYACINPRTKPRVVSQFSNNWGKLPFAAVIGSKPTHGMFVLHTPTFDLYTRMWCAHEVDECRAGGVERFGAFDSVRYNQY